MSGSRAQGTRWGLPNDFKPYSIFPGAGLNQSASREAIDDKQFYWLENYIRIGDGKYRTLYDKGAPLYNAATPGSILPLVAWFNVGSGIFAAVFLDDGTAVQVSYPDGNVVTISDAPLTFYSAATKQLPAFSQSGTQYLLISNNNTENDFWIWDGSLLYGAGGIAPTDSGSDITDSGTGYSTVPGYTIYGGSGSGIVLTPVISEGSVVELQVVSTGQGYLPGDVVQVQFKGGGSDTAARLTANLFTGGLESVTVIAPGNGYPDGQFALGVSGGGGNSAAGYFIVQNGSVTQVQVTSPGGGFASAPTITFPVPGAGATATATAAGGAVTAVTLGAGGAGYVPGTYSLQFVGGGGSGATGSYTVGSNGVVTAVNLGAHGSGYTSAPTVIVSTGSGAVGVAAITANGVSGINIEDGGSGYTGTPTLTFKGGGGSGAIAVATVTNGVITGVSLTNGGSYTTAPSVVVQTGVNRAAAATLELMPFGVSGDTIETYQQRVWIAHPNQTGKTNNGGKFLVSAPGALTDFATSDGGDIFTNTDRFLRQQYTFLRQTSNFLYAVGDSSVSVISNVQTGGTPTSTTFSYQNTDPQIGSSWRDTAQDYSNTILFANAFGVYGVYGGSVRKVSKDIDDLFTNAILPPHSEAVFPSGAVHNAYSQKVYLLLITIQDPFNGKPRNVLLGWNEKEWFVASQSGTLTAIGTQEVNSNITAWGTDGSSLFPLFQTPSATLVKTISTKLYGGSQTFVASALHSLYISAEDKSVGQAGLAFIGTADGLGVAKPFVNSVTSITASVPSISIAFGPVNFVAPNGLGAMYGFGVGAGLPQMYGVGIGVTLASSDPDFILRNLALGIVDQTAIA